MHPTTQPTPQPIPRPAAPPPNPLAELMSFDLRSAFFALWRRKMLLLACMCGFALLALFYALNQPKEYTAVAVLQLNPRQAQVVDVESVLSGLALDQSVLQSELDILKSSALAAKVVDELDLVADAVFNPALRPTVWAQVFGQPTYTPAQQRQYAIAELQRRVRASSPPRSLTLELQARARSPEQAEQFANAMAQAYLQDQLETRLNATVAASDWLNTRITELRAEVTAAEQAVHDYRQANNLFEQQGITLNDQQMSELNSQLILARTSRAEAEAKLQQARRQVQRGDISSAADVLDSPLVQRLREQEAVLLRQDADLATRYGARHPQIIKVRAELQDLKAKIQQESQNIIASYANELEIARTREQELQNNLRTVQREAGQASGAEIFLAELVREAQASKALYEAFLARSKETTQQKDLQQTDARLVAAALPPLKHSHPKTGLLVVAAALVGLAVGVLLVILLERLDRGFRSAEQLERVTGRPVIGQIPMLSAQQTPALAYLLAKPTSAFAEAIRAVRTTLHYANPDHPPQVVLVTSAQTNEGKSSFALSLATLAAKGGANVLLVDCDLRRPSVAAALGQQVQLGLGDLLVSQDKTAQNKLGKLREAIQTDATTGLHFLPAKPDTPNSNELLASQKMAALLTDLRDQYDLIVLDCPPIGAVADALSLAQRADVGVFVVRWGETVRDAVTRALEALAMTHLPLAGLVLNQVDVKQSGYYYGNYNTDNTYYHN